MMQERIEHTEHRRAADERREPVAWAGPSPRTVAVPTPAPQAASA